MQQHPNLNIIIEDANDTNIADIISSQLIIYINTHIIPDHHFYVIKKYVESFVKDSISLWKYNAIDVQTNFNTVGTYTEFYAQYILGVINFATVGL